MWNARYCEFRVVSFRTAEAVEYAAGNSFYERMIPCVSRLTNARSKKKSLAYFFISRAYTSNHVLVYQFDPSNGNIYLENLSSNVPIVDELNSFDLVENLSLIHI